MLSIQQTAEELGVSTKTVRNYIAAPEGVAVDVQPGGLGVDGEAPVVSPDEVAEPIEILCRLNNIDGDEVVRDLHPMLDQLRHQTLRDIVVLDENLHQALGTGDVDDDALGLHEPRSRMRAVCGQEHESPDGPCPGYPNELGHPNCWEGDDEFQFHGEWHTYRWGWGWTVPFIGCIVSENWDGDLLDVAGGVYALPLGEHPVDEEWYDDTGVSLTLDAAA